MPTARDSQRCRCHCRYRCMPARLAPLTLRFGPPLPPLWCSSRRRRLRRPPSAWTRCRRWWQRPGRRCWACRPRVMQTTSLPPAATAWQRCSWSAAWGRPPGWRCRARWCSGTAPPPRWRRRWSARCRWTKRRRRAGATRVAPACMCCQRRDSPRRSWRTVCPRRCSRSRCCSCMSRTRSLVPTTSAMRRHARAGPTRRRRLRSGR